MCIRDSCWIQPLIAMVQQDLRRSLDQQHTSLLSFNYSRHPLPGWRERHPTDNLIPLSLLIDIHIDFVHILQYGDFSRWSLLLWFQHSSAIDTTTHFEQLLPLYIATDIINWQLVLVRIYFEILTWPYFSQCHLVHSQSASFVRTDVVCSTHCLASIHATY